MNVAVSAAGAEVGIRTAESADGTRRRRGVFLLAALGFLAAAIPLHREVLDWDGIAFLLKPRAAWFADPAHLLYPAALHGAVAAGAAIGLSAEAAGRLLSSVAAAAAFGLLAGLLERLGHRRGTALAAAALAATAPGPFRQAVNVEVYAPALLFTVLAGRLALVYSGRPAWPVFLAALASLAAATGFHVGALLAAFWMPALVRAGGGRLRPVHVLTIVAGVLGVAAAFAGGVLDQRLFRRLLSDIRGFLPSDLGQVGRLPGLLGAHVENVARYFAEEAPVLLASGLAGLVVAVCLRSASARPAFWLLVPHVATYAVTGTPLLGLLLPVMPALALGAAAGVRRLDERPGRLAAGGLVLAVPLAVQVALLLPVAVRESREVDPLRVDAEAVAAKLPAEAVVVAGPMAQHLRWFGRVEVLAVDELFHARYAAGDHAYDPVAVLRDAVRSVPRRRGGVFLTSEAAVHLFVHALPRYGSREEAEKDLRRRLLSSDPPVLVSHGESGPLWLQKLRLR